VVVHELPPIRFLTIDGESLAYRDFGGEGTPIVYLGSSGSHQDLLWDEPGCAHLLRSLGSLGRLVTYDRRGSGLSSRTVKPTIEVRVADVEMVLRATGIESAVLVAATGATETALSFGAIHPDMTRALVLYSAVGRMSAAPGYEIGLDPGFVEYTITETERTWGTGITALVYAPSLAENPRFVDWAARYERSSATPVEARQWVEMYMETDVRPVLPLVRAPALVVTPELAGETAPELSRYVADNLADVRAIEIPARDQWPFGDGMEALLDATSSFLISVGELEHGTPSTRRLAAVLFTDLVASTEHLRSMGDHRWKGVLDSHDDIAERAVTRHRGRVVKSTGDGVLAIFPGPESAVAAATEILDSVRRIGLTARAGVHMGELEVRGDDVTGIAVTLSSRITDCAQENEIIVSGTIRDLVAGSGLAFESKGPRALKGIEDPVELLALRSP
jgi:class 3 adenylate cyclase